MGTNVASVITNMSFCSPEHYVLRAVWWKSRGLCTICTPPWQIIFTAVQANVKGAAYIMDLSITPKITLLAEVDGEKGKNSDGDITPAKFVSTRPENGKTTQIPWLCCRVH